MKRERRVKILATLGPSSNTPETIQKLLESGADAFRINMSHTKHEDARALHSAIRRAEDLSGRPVAILVDLQGPKLRVGLFKGSRVNLKKGQTFQFDQDVTPGDDTRVLLPHPEIFEAVKVGDHLLLDDGKLRVAVTAVEHEKIICEVLLDGVLSNKKGVSLPETVLPMSAMSLKDRADLDFVLGLGVDWVALSFVQKPEDVAEAKKIAGGRAAIMAKIEKPSAIDHLDEIIELSDGLMVARGDLGVEMPLEQVPSLQKKITRACRKAGKPVVIATQMLESMITSPVPTRAEVSDVATAVFEGADAVMLSAESAAGQYPCEAVEMMNRTAMEVESGDYYSDIIHAQRTEPQATSADAISAAARTIAETLNLAGFICYTSSGSTGLRAARERPRQPILAVTPMVKTARKLSLVWGLHCVLTSGEPMNLDDMVDRACKIAFQEKFARAGDRVIISAGVPLGTPGATNMLRIAYVGADNR